MARGRKKQNGGGGTAPGIGDNSKEKPVPTPAIIASALTEITDIETEMAALSGKKGGIFNRYEKQGVDRKILRALVRLANLGSADEAAAYIQSLTQYAVATEVIRIADPAWTAGVQQAEMFGAADGDAAEELRRARAHKQGFIAGKKGHDIQSSPYQSKPGSIEFVGWRDGHVEGLAVRSILKPGSENVREASATPGPRRGQNASATSEALTRAVVEELNAGSDSALAAITEQLEQTEGGMVH
jgi:ribosome modulation factor/uncharacterized protein (UPF0335 family)